MTRLVSKSYGVIYAASSRTSSFGQGYIIVDRQIKATDSSIEVLESIAGIYKILNDIMVDD